MVWGSLATARSPQLLFHAAAQCSSFAQLSHPHPPPALHLAGQLHLSFQLRLPSAVSLRAKCHQTAASAHLHCWAWVAAFTPLGAVASL